MTLLRALLLFSTLSIGAGCGAAHDRREAELGALRAEVARMRAREQDRVEQVELLQNRILVLESRPGAAPGGEAGVEGARSLPVVALGPEAEPPPEPELGPVEGDLPEVHAPVATPRERSRRVELRDYGVPAPRRPAIAASAVAPPEGAPAHDTLGVVPIDGLPAPAAAEPSAYDDGVARARARDYPAAASSLRRFLAASPSHENAAAAQFLLADCLARQGKHLEAIGELERLARRHPGHRAAEVTLAIGLSYLALGDRDRARQLFSQVALRHPGTAAARRASERVAALGGAHP